MKKTVQLVIGIFIVVFLLVLIRDLNKTSDSLAVLKDELSDFPESTLSKRLDGVIEDTYKVEITETSLNNMLIRNKNTDSANPVEDIKLTLNDGSGNFLIEWQEGQSLTADVVVAFSGLTLEVTNVKVSGAGVFNTLLENFSQEILGSVLNSATAEQRGKLQRIEIQEGKLVIYYVI